MKILVISEVFYPENFLINDLVREWKKQGHIVDVISQYPSYPESYVYPGYTNKGDRVEDWEGSKIYRFEFIEGYKTSVIKKVRNYLKFILGASRIGKRVAKDYDLVFVSQTGPLTVALPAIGIHRKHKTPIAIWTFDIWPDVVFMYGFPKNKLTEWILNSFVAYIYRHFSKIIVSSSGFVQSIGKYVPQKDICYAPNWLQPVEFAICEIELDPNKFNFTFTGNISVFQNLVNTVKGFVKAKMEDCVLNIIGNGSAYNLIEDYIKENGVKNIFLHKRIAFNQIDDLLHHSDAFVLPLMDNEEIEKTEPLKLQSYLSVGKPILGILNGTCRELIEGNKIGVCAEPSNIDDIARGFKETKKYAEEHKQEVFENSMRLKNTRFDKQHIIEKINKALSLQ